MWRNSFLALMLALGGGAVQAAEGDPRSALIQYLYPGEQRRVYDQLVAMLDDQEAFRRSAESFYRESMGEEVDDRFLQAAIDGDIAVLLDLSGRQQAEVEDLQRMWEAPDVPLGFRLSVGFLLYLRSGAPEVGAQVLAADPSAFGFFIKVDPPVGFDEVSRRWLALQLVGEAFVDPSAGAQASIIAEVCIRHIRQPGLKHMVLTALPSALGIRQPDELLVILELLRKTGDEGLLIGFVQACRASGVQISTGEAAIK